jgi:hypothetical protein
MVTRRPEQIAADTAEVEATTRYMRRRQFAGILGEAIARAEAFWRLESALKAAVPER